MSITLHYITLTLSRLAGVQGRHLRGRARAADRHAPRAARARAARRAQVRRDDAGRGGGGFGRLRLLTVFLSWRTTRRAGDLPFCDVVDTSSSSSSSSVQVRRDAERRQPPPRVGRRRRAAVGGARQPLRRQLPQVRPPALRAVPGQPHLPAVRRVRARGTHRDDGSIWIDRSVDRSIDRSMARSRRTESSPMM